MICVGISFFNWNFRIVIYLYYLDRWCWETWVHHLERSQIGIILPTLWKRKQNNTKTQNNWRPRRKGKTGQLEQTEDEDNEGSREWVIHMTPIFQIIRISISHLTTKLWHRLFCVPQNLLYFLHYHIEIPRFPCSLLCPRTSVDISVMWAKVMCATSRTGPYTLSINILPCSSLWVIGEDFPLGHWPKGECSLRVQEIWVLQVHEEAAQLTTCTALWCGWETNS